MGKQWALLSARKFKSRKCVRPISVREFNHVTFKSHRYVLRRNRSLILRLMREYQIRYGVRLKAIAIMENHIHLAIRVPTRTAFQNFMRVFAGAVALKIVKGKLWSQRAWSRVVHVGRDLRGVLEHIWNNPVRIGSPSAKESFRISGGLIVLDG